MQCPLETRISKALPRSGLYHGVLYNRVAAFFTSGWNADYLLPGNGSRTACNDLLGLGIQSFRIAFSVLSKRELTSATDL
jgi:hypothetical protein